MINRHLISLLFLAFPLLLCGQTTDEPYRMKTVVIDAGHGGKDPGNLGTGRYKWREKNVALDVALKLGGYIKEQFPEINVLYTRDTDVFIGLNERADIANNAKADLFISIHCNAIEYPSARGVETFALGLHKNEENLKVAMKENSAITLEDDYEAKYGGFDPNSPEGIIALTMMQSAFLDQSLRISSYIQKQFKERVGRRDRGVKQAGFLVLRRTTMPSILIELGFLTNPEEEDFLNSESGRVYMSSAILRGFKEYKETVEDPLGEASKEEEKPKEVSVDLRQAELKAELERKKAELAAQRGIDLAAEEAEKAKEDSLKVEAEKKAAAEKAALQAKQKEAERIAEEARLKELADAEEKRLAEQAAKAAADQAAKERAEFEAAEQAKAKAAADSISAQSSREAELQRLAEEKKELEAKKQAEELAKIDAEKAAAHSELVEEQRKAEELRMAQEAAERQKQEEEARVAEEKRLAEENAAKAAKQAEIQKILEASETAPAVEEKNEVDEAKAAAEAANAAKLEELRKKKAEVEARLAKLNAEKNGEPAPVAEKPNVEEKKPLVTREVKSSSDVTSGLVFKIQIHTATKRIDTSSSLFRDVAVWEYEQAGLFKYTTGEFANVEAATPTQTKMRDLGFKGAFVVAFKDGQRIKVSEARALLNQ